MPLTSALGAMSVTRCPGCGARFPGSDGPTHRYLQSSPGCWAGYGDVLAREYSDSAYRAVHRLTVDAYSVQHPGSSSPQTIQSVAVHLLGLYATLELNLSAQLATAMIGRASNSLQFQWLAPPANAGALT